MLSMNLIRSKANTRFSMNIDGGEVVNAKLILFPNYPSPNEYFGLFPVDLESGHYNIVNRPVDQSTTASTSLVLDLAGNNVIAAALDLNSTTQQWSVLPDPAGSGYYYFQNVSNGMVIDIQNQQISASTPLIVSARGAGGPTQTQLWTTPLSAQNRTSFEILAQPIAPSVGEQPMPIPFVTQGFFVQVSNMGISTATVSLFYNSSPPFIATNAAGDIVLAANYIDNTGTITQVSSATFIANQGFQNIAIPSGGTFLFGVQYLLIPNSKTVVQGGTPQSSLSARGVLQLLAPVGSNLAAIATVRQVFATYTSNSVPPNLVPQLITESAYQVPFVNAYNVN